MTRKDKEETFYIEDYDNMNDFHVSDSGTITITTDTIESPYSISGSFKDTVTLNDIDMRRPLVVGDTELSEDKVKDLLVLLDIISELDDDNPIKEMFNCKKMLNKIKGDTNADT